MKLTIQLRRLFLISTFLLIAVSTGSAQQERWSALDQYIESSMKSWKVPGVAVSIVQTNSVVYLKGFGVRDIESRRPVTPDTLFDIGSCTKAFTAAAVAMLVDDGKMQWDGRMNKFIPFFHLSDPLADENVTLRDLLTHRTGVPETELLWYGSTFTREELVRRLAYVRLDSGFRSQFRYQNVMYAAAGYAVGEVAGGSWEEFIRQRIFLPLGMKNSDLSAIDAQKMEDHATPHSERPDGTVARIPWQNIDAVGPAGSINSSAQEMANWIALQLNDGVFDGKTLISNNSMAEMHRPQVVVPPGAIPRQFFPDSMQLSYGLGWFIQDYRGHQLILHPGDIDGFSTLVVLIPELRTGYVVLINLGDGMYRQVLGYHIADVLLNLPAKDWSDSFEKLQKTLTAEQKEAARAWESKRIENTHPSRTLPTYVGTYRDAAYGDVQISEEGDGLSLSFHSLKSKLEHFHYDTFVIQLVDDRRRVTFNLDADGNVAELLMAGIQFQRVTTSTSK